MHAHLDAPAYRCGVDDGGMMCDRAVRRGQVGRSLAHRMRMEYTRNTRNALLDLNRWTYAMPPHRRVLYGRYRYGGMDC